MQKAYTKLLEGTAEFLKKRISVAENEGDRDILSVACEKVKGLCDELSPLSTFEFLCFDTQDSDSAVLKELKNVCDKLSDLSIKADIQDHLASLRVFIKDDDDDIVDNDDLDYGEIRVYLQKKYILTQEINLYDQTLELMRELVTPADKELGGEYDLDHILLLKAYYAIRSVRADLSRTSDADMSSSVWNQDFPLMIIKSRSEVENHLNVVYGSLSNSTYKRDLSQHLADFKEACLLLPNLPSQILDSSLDYTEWKRMSSRSGSSGDQSGYGSCKSPFDIPENHKANDDHRDSDYYYRYVNSCILEEEEHSFPRVIRIGNSDPKHEGQGISLLDPSALCDDSEDEHDVVVYMSGPDIPSEDELAFLGIMSEDELDPTDMSEGSPKVHPEDEVIMHV